MAWHSDVRESQHRPSQPVQPALTQASSLLSHRRPSSNQRLGCTWVEWVWGAPSLILCLNFWSCRTKHKTCWKLAHIFYIRVPSKYYAYPGHKKKKEPCCWCIKSESCDIEESRCLLQLRNREWTRLATVATSRIDASMPRSEIRR